MQPSHDISWLDVGMQENGRLAVLDHDRLGEAITELPHQEGQYPSLCVFLGGSSRENSLQQMFPLNNIRRHTSEAHVKLRYDIGSINTPQPMLFADGDFPKSKDLPVNLQAGTGFPTAWNCQSVEEMLLVLWARLIFLFADVVCIFIDDLSELDIAVDFLARCAQLKCPSPWIATCPRLTIAFGCGDVMPVEEIPEFGMFCRKLQSKGITDLNTIFSDVQSINPIGDLLSSSARHDRVKRLMMEQLDVIGTIRKRYLGRASGKHLAALFQAGLRHTVMDIDSPFNHFMAVRNALPVSPTAGSQLRHFLEMGSQAELDLDELAPSIASAVLMDHYVPGMIMSNARLVFQALYRSDVLHGCRMANSLLSNLTPEENTNIVESKLMAMFECLSQTDCSSVNLRENQLISQSGRLARIQSTHICLYCIFRSAQHVLACGHTLCDHCVQIFGTPGEWEYQFIVKGCLYCLYQRPLIVEVLPPTMTPSILAIDGGGVRGVIPLEFLLLLGEQLAPCTIHDVVDLAVGTSSGGLIALGIFIMRWTVRDCSETFERLARQIFRERRHSRWPWGSQGDGSVLGEITRWIHWLLHDSCYDAQVFDTALKTAFGDQRRIFGSSRDDPQGPLRSGPKVGVITTSISRDTSAFVIGNFNAAHDSETNSDYEIIRPENKMFEPRVWNGARATAAAPFFFTPAYLHGIGSFQDGGLKHNFPGEIAWQICRQIWPHRSGSTRMLSLGTGRSEVPSQPTPHFRHVFRDGFLRRGFDAWMSTMESERDSRRLESRLKSSQPAEYHRLNVPLKNVPESIDAIESIETYRDLVILQPGSARMAREAAMMLLISRFYFVLGDLPKNTAIPFWCRGFIHCKGSAKDVIAALQRLHPDGLSFVSDCGRGDTIADLGKICSSCGCCKQPITFLVRHIDHVISIFLQSGSKQRWRMSGFPGSVNSFAIRQGLESPFGRVDHGYPSKAFCNDCNDNKGPPNKRRRREKSGSSEGWGSKRVCLDSHMTGNAT